MSGESPTRPGIFHASPEVVVTPEISPPALTARQLIVPVGRLYRTSSIRSLSAISSAEGLTRVPLLPLAVAVFKGLGPQASVGLSLSFHASHILRDSSVRRFSRLNPCLTANRNAPSPTSRMWSVRSRMILATLDGFLIS